MRASLEPAYVLHSRPYRESSVLLEALSRNHGRIGLVARGARLVEVPVQHLPRESGVSSGGNPRVIARAFRDLFLLYGKLKRQPDASI